MHPPDLAGTRPLLCASSPGMQGPPAAHAVHAALPAPARVADTRGLRGPAGRPGTHLRNGSPRAAQGTAGGSCGALLHPWPSVQPCNSMLKRACKAAGCTFRSSYLLLSPLTCTPMRSCSGPRPVKRPTFSFSISGSYVLHTAARWEHRSTALSGRPLRCTLPKVQRSVQGVPLPVTNQHPPAAKCLSRHRSVVVGNRHDSHDGQATHL